MMVFITQCDGFHHTDIFVYSSMVTRHSVGIRHDGNHHCQDCWQVLCILYYDRLTGHVASSGRRHDEDVLGFCIMQFACPFARMHERIRCMQSSCRFANARVEIVRLGERRGPENRYTFCQAQPHPPSKFHRVLSIAFMLTPCTNECENEWQSWEVLKSLSKEKSATRS